MKELGAFAPGLHAGLAGPMVEAGVDHAILVGAEMAALPEALRAIGAGTVVDVPGDGVVTAGQDGAAVASVGAGAPGTGATSGLGKGLSFAHCRDGGEARRLLDAFGLGDGDVVLVKGSNSVGLGALVAGLVGR
jgi:UDP-N-acetylmuramoyl-tripeptide--D-alanyl-D-alanine ligase